MALNLVKLCVGIAAVEELQAWVDYHIAERRRESAEEIRTHTTRMVPKRRDEILDGGSLYWVIKGNIQVRQIITDIRPFTDKDGIRRCDIVMEPRLILTEWHPRRAFQGWRYLKPEDTPADIGNASTGLNALPQDLRIELSNLGLL